MKIRHIKDIAPIHLHSKDTLELRYEEHDEFGKKILDRTLHHEQIGRDIEISRIAVVDFEDGELKLLGMNDAIGAVFGEGR
jgi:hypothetical protein